MPNHQDTHQKTFCRLCMRACAIRVKVENGRITEVKRDAEDPLDRGPLCPKGYALPKILNHPDRLRYPLKQQGKRGQGKWKRISWDEALGIVTDKLLSIKQEFGAETVAFGTGHPKALEEPFVQRLASVFGTPNVFTANDLCYWPRIFAHQLTFGASLSIDRKDLPKTMVIWGMNPLKTRDNPITDIYKSALDNGATLIVIDPQKTKLASKADLWLQVKPGTDLALALGMLKILIQEELYDVDFVQEWTLGFDKLQDHIKPFSLEMVEELTGVPLSKIVKAIKIYARNKPSTIGEGNPLDTGLSAVQTHRAISILRAITGNIGVKGSDILVGDYPVVDPEEFMLLDAPSRNSGKMIGKEFKVGAEHGFCPRHLLPKAILEGDPYYVQAALFFGSNSLVTYPDANKTYNALANLKFLVVSDLFMTPTASLADIVLPAATNGEVSELAPYPPFGGMYAYPKIVDPPYETRSDMKMINELAKKLGLGEYFWDNEEDALDFILSPMGISFEQFKEKRCYRAEEKYREHGFKTPSGKVEIYSQQFKDMGYKALPPLPDVNKIKLEKEYPLLFTTSRSLPFIHSAYRNVDVLRKIKPEPIVKLHPETANDLNIKEGEWINIETEKGKIRQKVSFNTELDPRVIIVSYGWWFPEKGPSTWKQSNVNVLTKSEPPYDPSIGTVKLRGVPCKVSKSKEG